MRTALVLLFALAVAAIPGSLVPQRRISPVRVSDFIATHPTLGPVYDKIGLFDVYTSPWFSAIYLLLFVSLVGCIVPRIVVYARALRAQPPRTPRNLSRLPGVRAAGDLVEDESDDVLERAATELRRQHYRVRLVDGSTGSTGSTGSSVAAERGYLREAGNLVFHVSLLFLLLGVAIGALWGFRGSSVVIVGQGFSNSVTQYDDLSAGGGSRLRRSSRSAWRSKNFHVKFETGDGPDRGGAAVPRGRRRDRRHPASRRAPRCWR